MKIKKIQIILRKNMKNLYFLLKDVISQFLHKMSSNLKINCNFLFELNFKFRFFLKKFLRH